MLNAFISSIGLYDKFNLVKLVKLLILVISAISLNDKSSSSKLVIFSIPLKSLILADLISRTVIFSKSPLYISPVGFDIFSLIPFSK